MPLFCYGLIHRSLDAVGHAEHVLRCPAETYIQSEAL